MGYCAVKASQVQRSSQAQDCTFSLSSLSSLSPLTLERESGGSFHSSTNRYIFLVPNAQSISDFTCNLLPPSAIKLFSNFLCNSHLPPFLSSLSLCLCLSLLH